MHPRTVFIAAAAILAAGLGARWAVYHFALLPLNDEMVLRSAVAVTVTYPVDPLKTRHAATSGALAMVPGLSWALVSSNGKSVRIDRPDHVAELLGSLRLRGNTDFDRGGPPPMPGGPWVFTTVTFHFPDGTSYAMALEDRHILGQHPIDPRFADQLRSMVSRLEGKDVDLFPRHVGDPWDRDGRFRDGFRDKVDGLIPPPPPRDDKW